MKLSGFPIMRQVHLVAAGMIFFAFAAAHFFGPNFIYLALLVGVGLTVSAVTGYCPMAFLLQLLPWNKGRTFKAEVSGESNNKSCCS